MRVKEGSFLGDFLLEIGFPDEYIEKRVQTIFLDGKTIDDPRTEVLRPGAAIALSAALPGLAGAMFRRKSPVSALRTRTADLAEHLGDEGGSGFVLLKLFNLVAEEMGPLLMQKGIFIRGRDLAEEFTRRWDVLAETVSEARLDGEPIELASLRNPGLTESEYIRLIVSP